MAALATDKKHAGGGLRWVLPTADGYEVRSDVPVELVERVAAGLLASGRAPAPRRAGRRDPRPRPPGPEPEPARHARAGDLRPRHARRHPRRDRRARRASSGLDVAFFQSNHEGALIDRLHERDFDAAIVNAGGLTHTSVALRDALLGGRAAVLGGPPLGPRDARAVPPGQLPRRRRAGLDRRPGQARLPARARRDRGAVLVADETRRAAPSPAPDRRARPADRRAAQRASRAGSRRRPGEGRVGPAGRPRRGARARGAAPGHDGERGPDAPGRPARDLPPAHRGDAGARDARPGAGSEERRQRPGLSRPGCAKDPSAAPAGPRGPRSRIRRLPEPRPRQPGRRACRGPRRPAGPRPGARSAAGRSAVGLRRRRALRLPAADCPGRGARG